MGVSWPFPLFFPVIVQALPSLFHYITLINWHPTPIFLPGKPHGWRSPAGYSPRGHKIVRQSWWTGHRSREQRGGGRPRKPTVESAAIAPFCHKGALWATVSNRRSGQIPEGTCQDVPAAAHLRTDLTPGALQPRFRHLACPAPSQIPALPLLTLAPEGVHPQAVHLQFSKHKGCDGPGGYFAASSQGKFPPGLRGPTQPSREGGHPQGLQWGSP